MNYPTLRKYLGDKTTDEILVEALRNTNDDKPSDQYLLLIAVSKLQERVKVLENGIDGRIGRD